MDEQTRLKLEKLKLLEEQIEKQQGLPHLYALPRYHWQREFFESTNRENLITAANQVGKSSINIHKCIEWSVNKSLWPKLWRSTPRLFWYTYPNKETMEVEFDTKWVPECLPRNSYKKSDDYGWEEIKKHGDLLGIKFNSGVTLSFKQYSMKVENLQAATVWAVFADEEVPESHYDEIRMRLQATDGYFHSVFTATLGQEFWYKAMERIGHKDETFVTALKRQVSLYDCMYYEDGRPSHWTRERIQRAINSCKSEAEVQRRIFGRFVRDEGLQYPSFSRDRNIKLGGPIPEEWLIYAAVDIGTGGTTGSHPAAITFLAVAPDFRRGRVVRTWRGDKIITTVPDILKKYREMRRDIGRPVVQAAYDYESKEFFNVATQMGEPFVPADKARNRGQSVVNVLFKNSMLTVDEEYEENDKLVTELTSLREGVDKSKAKDDLVDSTRYACMLVPWDFTAISSEMLESLGLFTAVKKEDPRWDDVDWVRANHHKQAKVEEESLEQQFDDINEMYEA